MEFISILESFVAGLFAGFICGLTGMGGGTIYVPVFYFMLGSIKKAIGTSLLVILVSSVSAFISHMKADQVNFKITGFLIISGIIGAQYGSLITANLPETVVKIFFVSLAIALAINMWRERLTDRGCSAQMRSLPVRLTLIGFSGGLISGMGGVGGAIVIVPFLHLWIGLPMKICIGTVLSVVMFNSLSAVAGYIYHGFVDFHSGTIAGLVAVFSAKAGSTLSLRTDNRKLRKIFSIVLLFAGIAVLIRNP
ncbi:MAG: sulfite exporter TauE/SafE family protein [Candidatus Omnitrophica bacterium]|nr:sulfite exporter TauE/SafE family protein [Candidatus Omnitrophota bacterium]MCM8825444.1 sulfite exporter TauE/SafE family protein [Candidatus Omnitrophota bacterium]